MSEVQITLEIRGGTEQHRAAFTNVMDSQLADDEWHSSGYLQAEDDLRKQLDTAETLFGPFAWHMLCTYEDGNSELSVAVPGAGYASIACTEEGMPIVGVDVLVDLIGKADSLDSLRREVEKRLAREVLAAWIDFDKPKATLETADVTYRYYFSIHTVLAAWPGQDPEFIIDQIIVGFDWYDADDQGPAGWHVDVTANGWKSTSKGIKDKRETRRHTVGGYRYLVAEQATDALRQALALAKLPADQILNPDGDIPRLWTLEAVRG